MASKRPVKTVMSTEAKVAQICEKAREQIYAKVLAHYRKHPGSAWSGHYLVDLEKTIKALYAQMGVDIGGEFRAGLPKTMREFYDMAAADMRKAGKRNAILGKPDTERINYFLNNSFEQIAMRTQRMSFDHIKQLRTISADVLRTASLTGASRKQVTKELLAKATEIPGFKFTAANGAVWKDETYFKMLARTELINAGRTAYDDTCAQNGYDVVMLDFSGNSCEACAQYEGCLFSLTGATPGLPTKDDLISSGVFHPNCTHSYTAVPDFIRETEFNPDGTPKAGGAGVNHKHSVQHKEEKQQPAPKPKPEPAAAQKAETEKQHTEYETKKAAFIKQGQQAVYEGLARKEFVAYAEQQAKLDADRLQLTGEARKEHIADFKQRFIEEQRKNFEAIAGKVAAEYQPGMEKYGDLPKLVFDPATTCSHVTGSGSELHILTTGTPDFVKWCQLDGTIKHEFEHWLQIKAMKSDPTLVNKIRAAGTADWQRIKNSYKGRLEMLKGNNSIDMVTRWLYNADYGSLTQEQRHAVISFTDSFGSLAGGQGYGFGHPDPGYYKRQNQYLLYGEAIANVKALQSSVPHDKLQKIFPELDKLVKELQNHG